MDVSGYLNVVVHGLVLVTQSVLLGGVLFLVLLARPQGWLLGRAGLLVQRDTARIAGWAALGLGLAAGATVAMQAAVLMTAVGLPLVNVLQATFALAGLVKIAMALLLAAALFGLRERAPGWLLLPLGAVELAAAAMTTHAAARLELRAPLLAATIVHQFGAAIWIGAIPCFVSALRRVNEAASWEVIGSRFSRMSMLGVACIALSGVAMAYVYVGDWSGLYGTAYGATVGVKVAMFVALLGLGGGNYLAVRRLSGPRGRMWGVNRLKRFAEVEIGVGFAVLFVAAALGSMPPAVDLPHGRATLQDIAAGLMPAWPDYTRHWVGILVLAIGVLAVLNRIGLRATRHWPLLLLGLGGVLFLRSGPVSWPLKVASLWHYGVALMIVVLGLLEWRVRRSGQRGGWQPLVFPLSLVLASLVLGGMALLTYGHASDHVGQRALMELTHIPLALAGMAAGWACWLEQRLEPPGSRVAGWVWPLCFVLIGALLLLCRPA